MARKPGTTNRGTKNETRPVHVHRDAKTGRFVKQVDRATSKRMVVGPEKSPAAFLDRFTAHPVVDELMKRLSR